MKRCHDLTTWIEFWPSHIYYHLLSYIIKCYHILSYIIIYSYHQLPIYYHILSYMSHIKKDEMTAGWPLRMRIVPQWPSAWRIAGSAPWKTSPVARRDTSGTRIRKCCVWVKRGETQRRVGDLWKSYQTFPHFHCWIRWIRWIRCYESLALAVCAEQNNRFVSRGDFCAKFGEYVPWLQDLGKRNVV